VSVPSGRFVGCAVCHEASIIGVLHAVRGYPESLNDYVKIPPRKNPPIDFKWVISSLIAKRFFSTGTKGPFQVFPDRL
jgi:hypothetical protein